MKYLPISPMFLTGVAALVMTHASIATALTVSEVEAIAQQITVKIDSSNPGSGVIIQRDGNVYTLLTAAHVVETEDNYAVLTHQKQRYPIVPGSIQKVPNLDLATVKFVSDQTLAIAELGNSNAVKSGEPCYVSGHPLKLSTYETRYKFAQGYVSANSSLADGDGYSMAYFNYTYRGMSGGPVLNRHGQVIGIHGRSLSPFKTSGGVDQNLDIKFGVNMAIPINVYLRQENIINSPADDLFIKGVQGVTDIEYNLNPIARLNADNASLDGYRDAIQYFDQAIELNPNYGSAYIMRGVTHTLMEQNQKALSDLNTGIQIIPNTPLVYYFRAAIYSNLNREQEALADIERWESLDPDNPAISIFKAMLNFGRDPKSASNTLDETLQKDPDNAKAILYKATLLMQADSRSNTNKVLDLLNQAIELDPGLSTAYFYRGMIYRELGETEKSYQDFKAAKETDIGLFSGYDPTILAAENLDDPRSLDELKTLDPHNASIHMRKAGIHLEMQSFREALGELDKAIDIDPNLAEAYIVKGFLQYRLGNKNEAMQTFQKARDIDPQLYKAQNVDERLRLMQRFGL